MSNFVTLAQISDSHLRAAPDDSPASPDRCLQSAVEQVAAHGTDALLLTGDLTDDGSPAAYRRIRAIVDALGVPVLATPGNHDDPAALAMTFPAPGEMVLGGWRVLLVDTMLPGRNDGRVNVDTLIERLGHDEGQPTIVAMHHPPITTSTHEWFQLDGAEALVAALGRRNDVKVVLSGHLHQAFNVVLGRVSYIGCSSSWYSIAHRGDEYSLDQGHVGALVLRLHDDGRWTWRRLPDPHMGADSPLT
ncbi:MAG: metallophosphoesterase [Ilumatobacteraceae bacterium]